MLTLFQSLSNLVATILQAFQLCLQYFSCFCTCVNFFLKPFQSYFLAFSSLLTLVLCLSKLFQACCCCFKAFPGWLTLFQHLSSLVDAVSKPLQACGRCFQAFPSLLTLFPSLSSLVDA